jgi:uncharacterized membrane protein YdbT with pleckstrin-like domain
MVIKAKKDSWISLIMILLMMTFIVSVIIVPHEERWIVLILIIPVAVFLGWIYFGTNYELTEKRLICRSGPFSEKIPYDNIRSVKLCRNFMSSMALSRDRIEIKQHGKGYISGTTYISPVDRERFLFQLKQRCHFID